MQRTAHVAGLAAALGLLLGGDGCVHAPSSRLPAATLAIRHPALYPETVLYDPAAGVFLVSSLRDGGIYAVDGAGRVSPRVKDPRLCSVLGIALDSPRGRLWAVNADLGVSLRPSPLGRGQVAAVAMYAASSGAPEAYVDLALLVDGPHLLNGLALDEASGDAFVTDSFAPAIYRVRADGGASVFLQSPRFAGPGINLNGLVVHPDGYLLVVKKNDGLLFKVPLSDPAAFREVRLDRALQGADGVMLMGRGGLAVVANQVPGAATNATFFLASSDGWESATVARQVDAGPVYPTTSVSRDGTTFVLASHLDELLKAPAEAQPALRREGELIPLPANAGP